MIVCCTEDKSATSLVCSSNLKNGKKYHVMGIYCETKEGIFYRIIANPTEPGNFSMAYYPAECFTVETTFTPSNWGVRIYSNGDVSIAPSAWLEDGFYEKFYDSDPSVYHIFEYERDTIIAEEQL